MNDCRIKTETNSAFCTETRLSTFSLFLIHWFFLIFWVWDSFLQKWFNFSRRCWDNQHITPPSSKELVSQSARMPWLETRGGGLIPWNLAKTCNTGLPLYVQNTYEHTGSIFPAMILNESGCDCCVLCWKWCCQFVLSELVASMLAWLDPFGNKPWISNDMRERIVCDMLSFVHIVIPLNTAALCLMFRSFMVHFLSKWTINEPLSKWTIFKFSRPHCAKVHSMECSQGVHDGHLSDYYYQKWH